MTGDPEWDVVVVGAGPAGSSAARAAAEAGASVLIVERKRTVGVPVQCAEHLPLPAALELGLPEEAIAQRVGEAVTFIGGEERARRASPGCILRREVADALLCERAVAAGARLRTGAAVRSVLQGAGGGGGDGGPVRLALETKWPRGDGGVVTARAVVGADGPRSAVGAAVGASNARHVVGRQLTVELRRPSTETEVHLRPEYAGGYAWLFPRGELANVGVGVDLAMGGDPAGALRHFMGTLEGRVGAVRRSTGGLIPVGGPLVAAHGRVLLAGDAAGHTHAITGAGIQQAVEAGRLAGAAAAALAGGDGAAPGAYEGAFAAQFSHALGRAAGRRDELVAGWAQARGDPASFERLMRRCWVAFPEYHRAGRGSRPGAAAGGVGA